MATIFLFVCPLASLQVRRTEELIRKRDGQLKSLESEVTRLADEMKAVKQRAQEQLKAGLVLLLVVVDVIPVVTFFLILARTCTSLHTESS